MVEFHIVYHDEFGEVVEELGALIKEGGVVFIPLDDKVR